MKRPIVWCAAAFTLGTAVALSFSLNYILVITGCIIFTAYTYKKLSFLILIPLFFLGMLSIYLFNRTYIAPVEELSTAPADMIFEITDQSSSKSSGGYNLYTIKTHYAKGKKFESDGHLYTHLKYSEGDIVKAECNIYPHSENNSLKYYYISNGCYFTAYASSGEIAGKAEPSTVGKIKKLRKNIINTLQKQTDPENAGFLSAILTGDKENLTSYRSETFKTTGLSHLMAVSGLHVSLLHGFLFFLLNALRTKRFVKNIICSVFLLFLIPFMNFSPSATRAVIMNLVLLWSSTVKKDADSLSSLSFAAIIILIFKPYSLKDISFTLSFTATCGLILLSPVIQSCLKKLVKHNFPNLSAVLAVHIFLIPANIYYFGGFTPVSIPANIIFVPVFPVILILLMIALVTGCFISHINHLLNLIVEIYLGAIETVSALPVDRYEVEASDPLNFLLIITSALCFVFKSKMRLMFIAVSIIICVNIILKSIEIF